MLVSTARVARVLSPTSAVPAATAARARQSLGSQSATGRNDQRYPPSVGSSSSPSGIHLVAHKECVNADGLRRTRPSSARAKASSRLLGNAARRTTTSPTFLSPSQPLPPSSSPRASRTTRSATSRATRRLSPRASRVRADRTDRASRRTARRALDPATRETRESETDPHPPSPPGPWSIRRETPRRGRWPARFHRRVRRRVRGRRRRGVHHRRVARIVARIVARPQRISVADAVSSRARWPPRGPPRGRGDDGFHRRKVPRAKAPSPGLEEVLGDATRQRSSRPGVGGVDVRHDASRGYAVHRGVGVGTRAAPEQAPEDERPRQPASPRR